MELIDGEYNHYGKGSLAQKVCKPVYYHSAILDFQTFSKLTKLFFYFLAAGPFEVHKEVPDSKHGEEAESDKENTRHDCV